MVILQILKIYIYSFIGEGGVLHHGTDGLYCEKVLLEVKMSCNCEEIVDRNLTSAMLFREVVWQYVGENLNKVLVVFWEISKLLDLIKISSVETSERM